MDWQTALQTILTTDNPITILLAIVVLVALGGGSTVGVLLVRALTAAIPLIGSLVVELGKVVTTLHELSARIGDQLDALQRIDDGTKQRTEKGIAIILEHNERAFTAMRKQVDDNHAVTVAAIERLRIDVTLQLSASNRALPRATEHDKGTP